MKMNDQELIKYLQDNNEQLRIKLHSQTLEFAHLSKEYYAHVSKMRLSIWQILKLFIIQKLKVNVGEQK
jgi:hypothetical protein